MAIKARIRKRYRGILAWIVIHFSRMRLSSSEIALVHI